jgi:hypothetical protein
VCSSDLANSVAFGSDVNAEELAEIRSSIHMISGTAVRRGDASPDEIQTRWEPEEEGQPIEPLVEAAARVSPVTLTSPSALALIIANLVPVAGTIFLGWKLSDVMVLYWAESAVIGIINICKIASHSPLPSRGMPVETTIILASMWMDP